MKSRSITRRFEDKLNTLDRRALLVGFPLLVLIVVMASSQLSESNDLSTQWRAAGLVLVAFLGVLWNAHARHKIATETITELHADIEALRKRLFTHEITSNYDGLTGLPNCKLLVDRFVQSVARAKRGNTLLGVYAVSVEDYVPIAEWYGADAAAKVASTFAMRLKSLLRDSDTIVRERNGDFIILAESIKDQAGVNALQEKIRNLLAQDIELSDKKLVRAHEKIACACFPSDGVTLDALVGLARSRTEA